jgi:hypothetical protein
MRAAMALVGLLMLSHPVEAKRRPAADPVLLRMRDQVRAQLNSDECGQPIEVCAAALLEEQIQVSRSIFSPAPLVAELNSELNDVVRMRKLSRDQSAAVVTQTRVALAYAKDLSLAVRMAEEVLGQCVPLIEKKQHYASAEPGSPGVTIYKRFIPAVANCVELMIPLTAALRYGAKRGHDIRNDSQALLLQLTSPPPTPAAPAPEPQPAGWEDPWR